MAGPTGTWCLLPVPLSNCKLDKFNQLIPKSFTFWMTLPLGMVNHVSELVETLNDYNKHNSGTNVLISEVIGNVNLLINFTSLIRQRFRTFNPASQIKIFRCGPITPVKYSEQVRNFTRPDYLLRYVASSKGKSFLGHFEEIYCNLSKLLGKRLKQHSISKSKDSLSEEP